ncbi:oxidoreductase [Streptomyces sp. NPDC024062]|uniref:oxidoreductase n=1 Tax=unclassified Streptomyces TaxID=2593676 RepID=UPI00343F8278
MISYEELTLPERTLWDAFPEGRRVDLRPGGRAIVDIAAGGRWGPARTVRGDVITSLLLGANPARPGSSASLRIAGARITGSLNLAGTEVGYVVCAEECWFDEAVDLLGASMRSLVLTGCKLPGLEADSARFEGNVDLRRSLLESLASSAFNDEPTALSLSDARVAGGLLLNGARLNAPGGLAVAAGGLAVQGALYGNRGFHARGTIRLAGSQLARGLYLRGSRIEDPGPGGVALDLNNAVVSRLDCSGGFTAGGTVKLRRTQILDKVSFAGATLHTSADGAVPALQCQHMQAVDADLTFARPPAAGVDLRGAQVSYLTDSAQSYPPVVALEGFVYGSLKDSGVGEGHDSPGQRVAWIRRSPRYSPQPYEQLAIWYRTIGHDSDARHVLLAKQRHRRSTLSWPARAWGRLLDVTVGYGYRPWLAGLWLLVLTTLGTGVFTTNTPTPAKAGEGAPFQPLVYTLDLLIPIGGLGQRSGWYWPNTGPQWLVYFLIASGWVLTTAGLAGLTRALQKN